MKRRSFIQRTGIVAAAAMAAPSLLSAQRKNVKLVILHTNDTHSNIDPFPKNHPKYADLGGVSRRASFIKKVRSEEEHVLLLDAGDVFQGTPYFNKFNGVLEMKVMSEMQYDVATLGNHDFDIGMEGYAKAKAYGTFKVVNSNYALEGTPLSSIVEKNTIIKKGGYKIGIFGLGVDLNGLVAKSNYEGMQIMDPIQIAKEQVAYLKSKKCDYIICLSHLGYTYANDLDKPSDLNLAAKTAGINLIIGGHTHTFLTEITRVTNTEGKDVLINQVGYGGLMVGRIDVDFNGLDSNVISSLSAPLDASWV